MIMDATNPRSKFSIVVGTTRADGFKIFHRSLRLIRCPFHLIVSDASGKGYVESYKKSARIKSIERFTIIKDDPPSGFVRAYNTAFRMAETEWVLWLSDDCEILPDWDKKLMNFINENQNRDVIGAIYFLDPCWQTYRACSANGFFFANYGVVKKEVGEKIGWFDERFEMYFADPAFGLQAQYLYGIPTVSIFGCRIKHSRSKHQAGEDVRNSVRDKDGVVFQEAYSEIGRKLKEKIGKAIVEVGMRSWHRRADLQKAFPAPQDEKCAFKLLPNFLAWMKQYGVKEEPEIKDYFEKNPETAP